MQSHLQQQSHKSFFKRHEPSYVSHKGKVILWTLESFVTKGFVKEDFQRQKGSWMLNSFQNSTGAECLLPIYTFENHPMYYLSVFPGIFFLSPWYIRNVCNASLTQFPFKNFLYGLCICPFRTRRELYLLGRLNSTLLNSLINPLSKECIWILLQRRSQ